MKVLNFLKNREKILDYEINFSNNNIMYVSINEASVSSNLDVITFWAYYFSKIMFNIKYYDSKELLNLLKYYKKIINNPLVKGIDCFKILGINKQIKYSAEKQNFKTKFKGGFYRKKNILILNTKFSMNSSKEQVEYSIIAILQYIIDKYCISNFDNNILYYTIKNIIKIYEANIDICKDIRSLTYVPDMAIYNAIQNEHNVEVLSDTTKNNEDFILNRASEFAKQIVKKSEENAIIVYKYLDEESIDTISTWELYNLTFEYVIGFYSYIDRQAFVILKPEIRDKFMDLFIDNAVQNILERFFPNIDNDESYKTSISMFEQTNKIMKYYSNFQKIVSENEYDIQDTLICNIGKRICFILNHDNDTKILKLCLKNYFDCLSEFKIYDFLNKINEVTKSTFNFNNGDNRNIKAAEVQIKKQFRGRKYLYKFCKILKVFEETEDKIVFFAKGFQKDKEKLDFAICKIEQNHLKIYIKESENTDSYIVFDLGEI